LQWREGRSTWVAASHCHESHTWMIWSDLIWSDQTCLDCVSSEIWEVRIPQKDFGCRFFLSALNSQPMLDSQAAHSAIVHVYLQQKKRT
jgi:hypothetical protein